VSLTQAVSLADVLRLEPAGPDAGGDEIVCAGVEGPNLAAEALAAYRRASGWGAPPQRLTIDKHVPVAAGMGGGSSDAAATLRLAAAAAGQPADPLLEELASQLGSDVPSLLRPGLVLVGGTGEEVRLLPALAPYWLLMLPLGARLSTADVFAEADRLGLARPAHELAARRAAIEAAVSEGKEPPLELLDNDLEPAARSLCPAIDGALAAARDAGADRALVTGSGPTVVGVFRDRSRPVPRIADELRPRFPRACAADPLAPRHGEPMPARPLPRL
ncbi:MAG: 4-diphosphocytidyl-2-C-methyl-D-erythritol kinase, partial [Solirubrobacteraceae bacterium]|nr:4-diphosphocytidyl-2-C-methyl-D-erythritol kinase [Solirubrobacteraceae bacterium]